MDVGWLELWEAQLEDAGCQALATAVAVLQQLQWCLSDQSWGSQGFRGLRWRCGEVVLWHCPAQGKTLDQGPTEPASQVEMPPGPGEPGPDLPDRSASLVAFLFLNTPAWKPEWGGALRCVLKTGVQREVWGDGGRLVLLEEVPSHASPELMPSSHAQTVLILRLHSERQRLHIRGAGSGALTKPADGCASAQAKKSTVKAAFWHLQRRLAAAASMLPSAGRTVAAFACTFQPHSPHSGGGRRRGRLQHQFPLAAARREYYGLNCSQPAVEERFQRLAELLGISTGDALEMFRKEKHRPSLEVFFMKFVKTWALRSCGTEQEILDFLRMAPRSIATTSSQEIQERGLGNMLLRSVVGEVYELIASPLRLLIRLNLQRSAQEVEQQRVEKTNLSNEEILQEERKRNSGTSRELRKNGGGGL
eukprot:g16571.t2